MIAITSLGVLWNLYYEAIDLVIKAITERLDQPGYQIYRNLQDVILNTDIEDEL